MPRLLWEPVLHSPRNGAGAQLAFPADVWSLGVVLCVHAHCAPAPCRGSGEDLEGLKAAILRGKVGFQQPEWEGVSGGARDLVRAMLQVAPDRRLKARDILQHPWVADAPALAPPPLEPLPLASLPLPPPPLAPPSLALQAAALGALPGDALPGSPQGSPPGPGTPSSSREVGTSLAQQGPAEAGIASVSLHSQAHEEGVASRGEQSPEETSVRAQQGRLSGGRRKWKALPGQAGHGRRVWGLRR